MPSMTEQEKSVPSPETTRILEVLYEEAIFLLRETLVVAARFRRDSLVLGISAFPTAGGIFTYLTLVDSPLYSAILTLVSASILVVAGSAIIGVCLDIPTKKEIDWGYRLNMIGNITLEYYYREVLGLHSREEGK